MCSVICITFCECKNVKYSCQKDEPTFYSHKKMYKQISSVHGSSVVTVIKKNTIHQKRETCKRVLRIKLNRNIKLNIGTLQLD